MNFLARILYLACFIIAWPVAAQAPMPVGSLSPFCGEVKSFQEARESPMAFDASKAPGGQVFFLRNHDLYAWNMTDRGRRFVQVKAVPVAADSEGPLDVTKYRDGQFWRRRGKSVLRFDDSLKRWWTALQSERDFSTFDVSFDGRVVLVGTEKNLIEVYEAGAKEPLATEAYPKIEVDAPTRELLGFYWDEFVTSAQDEFLIIYAPGCGRMFLYDTHGRALKEASTPWKPFDPASAKVMAQENRLIVLNGFPGRHCIQLLPGEGQNAVVAYQIVTMEAKQTKGPDGRPRITQTRNTEKNHVHWYRWNLVDNAMEPVEEIPSMKLPVWLNSQDRPIPLLPLLDQVGSADLQRKP